MLGDQMFDKTPIPVLMKSLDASMLRSRVIANNIANINTPGYQRVEVSFEDALRKALDKSTVQGARTDDKHLPIGNMDLSGVNAKAYKPLDPTLASGVNNVDIDKEMADLAQTQIQFNFSVKFAKSQYNKLNASIQAKSIQQ
ncbi:MAG TPA: flagellar basal body rod protein FlgB [Chitinivibrionales bacterium]